MTSDFEKTLIEYGPLLSRVASSYEANHHLQQELFQEISLAVWQSLKGFKGNASIKTYILRVAHNRAVNHVAYHAKQPKKEQYADENDISAPHLTEKKIAQSQQVNQLLRAIRSLPLQSRQIVTMSLEGLSYQEISQVCGIQSSNVGAILSRAKKSLSEILENDQ